MPIIFFPLIIQDIPIVGGTAEKLERKRSSLGISSSKSTISAQAIVAREQKSRPPNKGAESESRKKGRDLPRRRYL